jgi:hypothetical protein
LNTEALLTALENLSPEELEGVVQQLSSEKQIIVFRALIKTMTTSVTDEAGKKKAHNLFQLYSEMLCTAVHEHPIVRFFHGELQTYLPIRKMTDSRYPGRRNVPGSNAVARSATMGSTAKKIIERFELSHVPFTFAGNVIFGHRYNREPDSDGTGDGPECGLVSPLYVRPGFTGEYPQPDAWFGKDDWHKVLTGPHSLLAHYSAMLPTVFDEAKTFYGVKR